jgi:hypothetical protein
MASTYTANTGIEKIGSGEQAGTWGTTTNRNFDIIDGVLNGVLSLTITGDTTLTTSDGATSNGHYKVLLLGGTPSGAFNLTIDPNDQQKWFFINNNSGQTCTVLQGGGTGTTVALGTTASAIIYADGAGANANVGTVSTDVLGDTTPQLGGNLDVNGKLIKFGDAGTAGTDDTLEFGASDDMQLYHDGTNSFITNATGALKIATETSGIAVTIGHTTSETTIADNATITGNASVGGTLGVTGVLTYASLNDGTTALAATSAELNIMDGGTSATSTTVVDADRLVLNDNGTMKQVAVTDISTYMNGNAFSAPSAITATSTLTPSAAKSIYQRVTTAGGAITLTVATGSLAIGQYVIIDKTAGSAGLTLSWAASSTGITLGSSTELAIGIYNGSAFSFVETIKS